MKKNILILIFILPIFVFAQNTDKVYLKNGSIISGNIIEMYPDSIIKITTSDDNLFVFKFNEILKTEKNTIKTSSKVEKISKDHNAFHVGYKGFVSIGVGYISSFAIPISTTHGCQFNEHLFAGLGATYLYDQSKEDQISLFTAVRYTPKLYNNGFYAEAKLGAEISTHSGTYFSPGAGYRISLNKALALSFGWSFDIYLLNFENPDIGIGGQVKFGYEF